MPPANKAATLRRTLRDIRQDRDAVAARAVEVAGYAGASGPPAAERAAALALALHFYYAGFEAFLERTLRCLDGDVPGGESWHTALLREAAQPLPDVRPAIVAGEDIDDWLELLRFRHFLRNAYRVELDWAKLARNAERVARLHPGAVASIAVVEALLEDGLARLTPDM